MHVSRSRFSVWEFCSFSLWLSLKFWYTAVLPEFKFNFTHLKLKNYPKCQKLHILSIQAYLGTWAYLNTIHKLNSFSFFLDYLTFRFVIFALVITAQEMKVVTIWYSLPLYSLIQILLAFNFLKTFFYRSVEKTTLPFVNLI